MTTLLVILVVFVFVNVIPWSFRLSKLRNYQRLQQSGANGKASTSPVTPPVGHLKAADVLSKLNLTSSIFPAKRAISGISSDLSLVTLREMVEATNYSRNHTFGAGRKTKPCGILPDNITVDLDDPFRVGVVYEIVGDRLLRENATVKNSEGKDAYVFMVSNHKYIDGAMVVADSLLSFSPCVQAFQCEIVLLVPDKINQDVLLLLRHVFDRVKVIRSLDVLSPKSYYKTTFDKMYLYYLHEYRRIVFFDADSLMIGNPDKLFSKVSDEMPLTAVGGGDYFQTALLVLRPDLTTFIDLYLEYRYGTFGYNQWRARDGILFRNCLMDLHNNMGHPTQSVFHFYGFTKPWFNHRDPKNKKLSAKGEPLEFNQQYYVWWERYEHLHRKFFVPLARAAAEARRQGLLVDRYGDWTYGATALQPKKNGRYLPLGVADFNEAARVSPADYMWLQRYSGGSEYLRPTFAHMALLRNTSPPWDASATVVVIATALQRSCDAVCAAHGSSWSCDEHLLSHSAVNDCMFVHNGAMGSSEQRCTSCKYFFDHSAAPFVRGGTFVAATKSKDDDKTGAGIGGVVSGVECFMNFLHDEGKVPLCNATAPSGMRRVCPCRRVHP